MTYIRIEVLPEASYMLSNTSTWFAANASESTRDTDGIHAYRGHIITRPSKDVHDRPLSFREVYWKFISRWAHCIYEISDALHLPCGLADDAFRRQGD